jgi:hypothetical protein
MSRRQSQRLDGGATVFPTTTVVDVLLEVHCHVAHHLAVVEVHAPRMAHASLTECATATQMAGAAAHGVAC